MLLAVKLEQNKDMTRAVDRIFRSTKTDRVFFELTLEKPQRENFDTYLKRKWEILSFDSVCVCIVRRDHNKLVDLCAKDLFRYDD